MIELLGLPGCGKSTFSSEFRKKNPNYVNPLEDRVVVNGRFHRNLNKIKPIVHFWFHQFPCAIQVFFILSKQNYVSIYERIKMFVYLYMCLGLIKQCKKNDDSYILFDEGILQTLWGVAYSLKNYKKTIAALLKILNGFIADEIIWFPIEREVVLDRLKSRNNNGGAKLQRDIRKDDKYIDYAIECLLFIKEQVEKTGFKIKEKTEK